ncbi:MAG: hypothetical protein ABIO36_03235 [Pyrinomonadaceae bacterium]
MKTQLQILGVIFFGLGALIALFVLTVLVLGSLNSLGITEADPEHGIGSALVVFSVLMYPGYLILQTGVLVYKRQRPGRIFGIIYSGILLVGLNSILLVIKDQPGKVRAGFVIFHAVMIIIGLYGLILLVPGRATKYFE